MRVILTNEARVVWGASARATDTVSDMRTRTMAVVVASFLVGGCGGYKSDVETVCNVRARAKIPANAEPAEQAEAIKSYLWENVFSPKAKKMFVSVGSMPNAERVDLLRRESKAVGLDSCPLADEAEAAMKKEADAEAARKAAEATKPPPAPALAPAAASPDAGEPARP